MSTGYEDKYLGRSFDGFRMKLLLAVVSLVNLVAMNLSPCQAHDSKHTLDVIGELRPEVVAMDKAYASEPLMDELRSRGIEPCIPSNKKGRSSTTITGISTRFAHASSEPPASRNSSAGWRHGTRRHRETT
jgi:hypothetical protein